ncbi:aspartyl-phosphate phosphatase Spo0E family protein [Ectobacillus ponti]|uniref:Aspartyl-phosphate phosphatase Spo0E family protein n=1 Tax=Ectobacillus ponti TaxID=2961894 RepID=A0AA42BRX0_9BACI|nr:aspartyl-phosphate phosphatase Spo0E family protein [Ectobacillus ponti]MCP8970781.1 aspartyl-phosphate phosphatase Spo0E family protein [Ectobacillus ponti]
MKDENLSFLYEEIERLRESMHETAKRNGLFHEETVRISQILDYLIVQYQRRIYHIPFDS